MQRKRLELKEKKGDVSDPLVILLITTFLAISFIVVLLVNNKLTDVIQDTALNESDASATIIDSFNTVNSTTVQRGFAFFIGILIVGVIASSFLVRLHPAFIFLYIIVLSFTVFVSVFLGNLYEDFTEVGVLAEIASGQDMINYIMGHILEITLIVGALSMIVVFSKIFRQPSGGDLGEVAL